MIQTPVPLCNFGGFLIGEILSSFSHIKANNKNLTIYITSTNSAISSTTLVKMSHPLSGKKSEPQYNYTLLFIIKTRIRWKVTLPLAGPSAFWHLLMLLACVLLPMASSAALSIPLDWYGAILWIVNWSEPNKSFSMHSYLEDQKATSFHHL